MHTERFSKEQTAAVLKRLIPLSALSLTLIAVAFFNSKTTNERIVHAFIATCIVMTLVFGVFISSRLSAMRRTLIIFLPLAVFLCLISFTNLSPIAVPAVLILALPMLACAFVHLRKWIATPLIVASASLGLIGAEYLQPTPPIFAGVYEIHIPGAEGLRWDIDLYTNLFGSFDDAPTIRVDGRMWPQQKPAWKYRILWVGDSQSLGPGVPPEKTAAHVMGARLREHYQNSGIQTINAGIWGTDDLMQWLYFDQILDRLDPDLVIVTWCGRIVPPFGSRVVYPHIQKIIADCPDCPAAVLAKRVRYGSANPFVAGIRKLFYESKLVRNARDRAGLGRPEHPELIPQSVENLGPIPSPSREEIIGYYLGHKRRESYHLMFTPEIDDSLEHFESSYAQIIQDLAPNSYIDVRPAFAGYSSSEIFADSAHFHELGHRLLGEFLANEVISKRILEENAP